MKFGQNKQTANRETNVLHDPLGVGLSVAINHMIIKDLNASNLDHNECEKKKSYNEDLTIIKKKTLVQ